MIPAALAFLAVLQTAAPDTVPKRPDLAEGQDWPVHTTDSVWRTVTAPQNVIVDDDGLRWVRNAMYLSFADSLQLGRKQAIVDSLGGRAVGGFTLGTRTFYLVVFDLEAVPRRSRLDAVLTLAEQLRAHPGIRAVLPIDLVGPEK